MHSNQLLGSLERRGIFCRRVGSLSEIYGTVLTFGTCIVEGVGEAALEVGGVVAVAVLASQASLAACLGICGHEEQYNYADFHRSSNRNIIMETFLDVPNECRFRKRKND